MTATGCGAGVGVDAQPPPQTHSGYPVSLINCGREVVVDTPPQRAVAINQPAAEIMFSLGLAGRMVGTASWTDPPLPSVADASATVPVLSQDYPSFERVLDEHPDFIYATFNSAFTDQGVAPRDRFEQLGVATYQSSSECAGQDAQQQDALTLDDLYAEINDIAAVFGVAERGTQLVSALQDRAATAAENTNADDVSLMWWYSSTTTPYLAGCCGVPGIITEIVGAQNAFGDSRQLWPDVTWEAVLDRDPDVIVLADLTRGNDGDSAAAKIAFLESNPVAQRLTAVRERRWIAIPGSAMDPGLRSVDAIEAVTDGLHELGVTSQ